MESITSNGRVRASALRYHGMGANVVPVSAGKKHPGNKWAHWQTNRQTLTDLDTYQWGASAGVLVINGTKEWRSFDFDKCLTLTPVHTVLDALGLPRDYPWVVQSGSGKGYHIHIRCTDGSPKLTAKASEKGVFTGASKDGDFDHLELRWERCLTMLPPSLHPSGGHYRWINSEPIEPPAEVPVARVVEAFRAVTQQTEAEPKSTVGSVAEGGRNTALTSLAGGYRRKGDDETTILAKLRIDNDKCTSSLSEEELRQIARSVFRYEPEPSNITLQYLYENESGDAKLLAHLYQGKLVYDHSEGQWYLWDGSHWRLDQMNRVRRLVTDGVAAEYIRVSAPLRERAAEEGEDTAKKLRTTADDCLARASQLRQLRRVTNVLTFAETELGITGEEWDRDPYLLGVANGVIDLRTGDFRPARPDDYIRTLAPTEWYGLDAACPTWEKFIRDIFDDKPDRDAVAGYVHRLLGSGTIGQQVTHDFCVFWGEEGRNGKDTLFETLQAVMGPELAGEVKADAIIQGNRSSEGAQPSVYALRGKRFAWIAETNREVKLDSAVLKNLVGGSTITARQLHKNLVTFKPSHLLFLMTNYKPDIPADDEAAWERVAILPFTIRFMNEPSAPNHRKRIDRFADHLKAESSGILAWLVRGCLEFQHTGLNTPASLRAEREKYREEMDPISRFIEEQCFVSPTAQVKFSDLHQRYSMWCTAEGFRPVSLKALGQALKKRGFEPGQSGVRIYRGLSFQGEMQLNQGVEWVVGNH